jgi:glycosyltransferase involved in cell wall biosynthesis
VSERLLLMLGPSRGGIGRHVADLARELRDRGWDVTVSGPASVRDLGFDDLPFTVLSGRTLRPLARAADLVHAHGLTAGWRARLTGRHPMVVTVHNTVSQSTHGPRSVVLHPLQQLLPRVADAVVCVSDEIARTLGGGPRLRVIPPYVSLPVPSRTPAEVRDELGVGTGALVVVPARLHPQKALPVLVAAATRVHATRPEVLFAIAGEGPAEAEVRAAIAAAGAGGFVRLLGFRHDLPDLLAAADVVALSSTWEGSPLSVQEAMALARPVVATDVGGLPDLIADGTTGRLVAPGEPAALAGALLAVLADPRAAATMGQAARSHIEALRGPAATVAPLEDLYRELLACA